MTYILRSPLFTCDVYKVVGNIGQIYHNIYVARRRQREDKMKRGNSDLHNIVMMRDMLTVTLR